jgi:hypothetical protein
MEMGSVGPTSSLQEATSHSATSSSKSAAVGATKQPAPQLNGPKGSKQKQQQAPLGLQPQPQAQTQQPASSKVLSWSSVAARDTTGGLGAAAAAPGLSSSTPSNIRSQSAWPQPQQQQQQGLAGGLSSLAFPEPSSTSGSSPVARPQGSWGAGSETLRQKLQQGSAAAAAATVTIGFEGPTRSPTKASRPGKAQGVAPSGGSSSSLNSADATSSQQQQQGQGQGQGRPQRQSSANISIGVRLDDAPSTMTITKDGGVVFEVRAVCVHDVRQCL